MLKNLMKKISDKRPHRFVDMGFTLAEVLITLGIIGIVAAMTIPTLIQNEQEKSTVTAVKKAYSTLLNAYNLAVKDNGTPDEWGLTGSDDILNMFAKYLNITKNCGSNNGCFGNNTYDFLDGSSFANVSITPQYAKAVLADGSYIFFEIKSPDCTQYRGNTKILSYVCATAIIDINGSKKPNQVGKDLFAFILSKYGIVPHGTEADGEYPFSTCTKSSTGWGCTAWVLYNENMDYLHCNDLSWDGKHTCN